MQIQQLSLEQKQLLTQQYTDGAKIATLSKTWCIRHDAIWKFLKRSDVAIRKDNYQANRRYTFDTHAFDRVDTEEKAYWLGFLYADGNHFEKRYSVSLSLAEEDDAHVKRFAAFLKMDRPCTYIKARGFNRQRTCVIVASDMHFSRQVTKLGLVSNKTFKLTMPDEFLVPRSLLHHFVRGYFDGDGSIYYTLDKRGSGTRRPNFGVGIVGTLELLQSLASVVLEQVEVNSRLHTRHKERNHNIRQLSVTGNGQVERFMAWLYRDATVFLERKHQKYCQLVYVNSHQFKAVEQLNEVGEVIAQYDSTELAAAAVGGNVQMLRSTASGKGKRYKKGRFTSMRKTYLGFGWRYCKNPFESFHTNAA